MDDITKERVSTPHGCCFESYFLYVSVGVGHIDQERVVV